jgi:iron complex outermembrane receptor protein
MGEVVVVGSRSQEQRSNLSTPVPIDVITSRQLLQSSQPTLTQMLQFSVPSINASRPLVNEPITLRGLDPDQTLILVNNKRFHNTAFMNFGGVRGILGRGAISNDINAIPYSAIDKVEILRDGASAQYGSDAIAGVINIRLKKNTNNIWAQLHTGQFYEKDGESVSAGINRGFAFIKNGYLNFSGTFRFQNPTYRGGEYRGTVYNNFPPGSSRADSLSIVAQDDSIISARNFKRNKVSNAGSSKHNGFNISLNGGYPINKRTEVFWTGGANYRTTIFTSAYTFPKDTSRINQLLFPDGYLSRPSNHTRDIWGIAGVKGESNNNWYWEYSIVYGNNRGKYYNKNTNLPSFIRLPKMRLLHFTPAQPATVSSLITRKFQERFLQRLTGR